MPSLYGISVHSGDVLICPVRGCGLDLLRDEGRVVCARGHSFDVARSGYINLLQPQDRRSKIPGDTAEAVAARRRLHDRGVTAPLLDGFVEMLQAKAGEDILDAGCGEGFYAGGLAGKAHGVDISIAAVDAAARRYPECEWVVANADRMLPYRSESINAVISITGRMNRDEFRRVLAPGGRLLVALAAPDDLIELRGAGRDRRDRTIAEFSEGFTLSRQERVTCIADLDASAVEDVLLSIYRPMRQTPVKAGRVTFSLDLLLFQSTYQAAHSSRES